MTERTGPSFEIKSPLGITVILQVLSAIMIIGGSVYFGPPSTEILSVVIAALLYAVGFIQIIMTRNVLQREKSALLVAYFVALSALAFSAFNALLWALFGDRWAPMYLFLIVAGINTPLGGFLNGLRFSNST
jgi:hypothetical protein